MPGALYQYMADDHERLDSLLQRAVAKPGVIDAESYHEFRKGLLRHISMEEKIVLPAIARWQGGKKAAIGERLRLDHGALVALLAPPPTPSIMLTIRSILEVHNELEERKAVYTNCWRTWPGLKGSKYSLSSSPPRPLLCCLIMTSRRFLKRRRRQWQGLVTNSRWHHRLPRSLPFTRPDLDFHP